MHTPDRGLKENFFRTDGRLNRKRFFLRNLVLAVLVVLLFIMFSVYIGVRLVDTGEGSFAAFLRAFMTGVGAFFLLCAPLIAAHYTLVVRRLHDLGMSGWYALFLYVPLVDIALFFYLLFKEGMRGENEYGADPLTPWDRVREADPYVAYRAEEEMPPRPPETQRGVPELRFFSMQGRLSRRDFALVLAVICGAQGLLFVLYDSLVLSVNYLVSAAFFRDATAAFWTLNILTVCALFFASLCAGPFLGVSAVVRRLHDMGRSGLFALPALLAILTLLVILGFYVLLWGVSEAFGMGVPLPHVLTAFMHWATGGNTLPYIMIGTMLLSAVLLLLLIPFNGRLFFGRGNDEENAYGAPPQALRLPDVRAAFLARTGAIDRRDFRLCTLLACAAASFILMPLSNFIINPLCMLLIPADILPYGSDRYLLILAGSIYPLAALPLVLRRLETLGRGAAEAVAVYAALLPAPFLTVPVAQFFGEADRLSVAAAMAGSDEIDPTPLLSLLTVEPSGGTIAFSAFMFVCGIASIISAARLLRD